MCHIPFDKPIEIPAEKSKQESREKSREKILKEIQNNPAITMSEITDNIGITEKAVEKQISQLKKDNKLKRVGAVKGGHWELL